MGARLGLWGHGQMLEQQRAGRAAAGEGGWVSAVMVANMVLFPKAQNKKAHPLVGCASARSVVQGEQRGCARQCWRL